MVNINGKSEDCAGQSLADYLRSTTYNPTRIAVERNGEIVPKSEYDKTILQDGDTVEIVSFVGGG